MTGDVTVTVLEQFLHGVGQLTESIAGCTDEQELSLDKCLLAAFDGVCDLVKRYPKWTLMLSGDRSVNASVSSRARVRRCCPCCP